MKKLYLLLLIIPLFLTSCSDDDNNNDKSLNFDDWNDLKSPNYKPEGYNPLLGEWFSNKENSDSKVIFTEDFKEQISYKDDNVGWGIPSLLGTYIINNKEYKRSDGKIFKWAITQNNDEKTLTITINKETFKYYSKDNSGNGFSTTSFGYITSKHENGESAGVIFARTPLFNITSENIQKMNSTDCAIISYEVVNYGSGINDAQNVSIKKLAYKGYLRPTSPTTPVDEIYPTEFDYDKTYGTYNYGYYSLESFFDDNWLFLVKFGFDEDTKVAAHFYYDESNQEIVDGEGVIDPEKQPKDNEIILDIRFERDPVSTSFNVPADGGSTYFVGNISEIRRALSGSDYPQETPTDIGEYIYVPVKFRLKMKKKDTNGNETIKETILGSWKTSDLGFRFFSFPKDQY